MLGIRPHPAILRVPLPQRLPYTVDRSVRRQLDIPPVGVQACTHILCGLLCSYIYVQYVVYVHVKWNQTQEFQ